MEFQWFFSVFIFIQFPRAQKKGKQNINQQIKAILQTDYDLLESNKNQLSLNYACENINAQLSKNYNLSSMAQFNFHLVFVTKIYHHFNTQLQI